MSTPQLGVSYVEDLPSEPFDEFVAEVQCSELDLRCEARERPGPYAGLEWLVPTAVVVFIGRAYFDAFLKEAGKDHYHILKAALKKLTKKFIGPSVPTGRIYFAGANKVQSPVPRYSLAYSVIASLGNGLSVKLLLPPDLSAEECNSAVEVFTAFLEAGIEGTLDPTSVEGLVNAKPVGGTLLVAYSRELKKLVVEDPIPKHVRERQA
ncbi:hypothetical protein [Solimonas flava]|uniref:hypothetical protein n=1 Tax=Solimonas flava TaxID=415849 RepID=UPI0012B5EBF9|nr:hypothetical protein [Solimonas flava]